jgi:phosphinothricin acetyltransferase
MTPVHTRPATLPDADAIAAIYNQGIEDGEATFETEPRTAADIAEILGARGDRYPYVVAERSGRVVAWAGCGAYRSRPCYAGVAEFSVYVERSARGTGAGKAALAALVSACEARGFSKLVSRIFPENQGSRALCASLGFREVGVYRRHGRLRGRWRDCVIVERLLGDAAAVEAFRD